MNASLVKNNINFLFLPLLTLIPLGWVSTYKLFEGFDFQYLLMSLISEISIILIIRKLKQNIYLNIHLWMIFIIILSGYYLKFYIYSFVLSNNEFSEFFERINPVVADLINEPKKLINYYDLISFSLVTFTLSIYYLKPIKRNNLNIYKFKEVRIDKLNQYLLSNKFRNYLIIVLLLSGFVLYLSSAFNIGIPGEEPLNLPFKLNCPLG